MTDGSGATVPEGFEDILRSTALAHVATIGPKGEPQSTPVWFTWDSERLRISQTEGQQKLKNLRREPRVALSFVDPANPGRNIEVRGRVEREDPDPDRAFVRELSRKYLGDESFGGVAGDHVVVVIRPEHVTTFDAGAMG
jgi:PPOX class probable F420-dependent enzyme